MDRLALQLRWLWAWWCAPEQQRLIWPSLALNAAYQYWEPARQVLPDPLYVARLVLGN